MFKKFILNDLSDDSKGKDSEKRKESSYMNFDFGDTDNENKESKTRDFNDSRIPIREFSEKELKETERILKRKKQAEEKGKKIISSQEAQIHSENIIADAKKKAENIIAEANKKAENISAIAKQDLQEIEKKAYLEGYEKGEKLGLEIGEKKLSPLQEDYLKGISRINDLFQLIKNDIEGSLLELVIDIAKSVIKQELKTEDQFIIDHIKECLDKIGERENLVIKISEPDYQMLKKNKGLSSEIFKTGKGIIIKKDIKMDRGSCIIESRFGVIDGRLDSQLKEVKRQFVKEFLRGE